MKLSIVSTLYQSAQYIEEFCLRTGAAAHQLVGDNYEIVLVNDGSPDNSLALAIRLCETDPHLVIVDLSRNFGHHKAAMAGLKYASGDYILMIDCDLEEKPEILLEYWQKMMAGDADVVYGVWANSKGGFFEKLYRSIFFKSFNFLSDTKIPDYLAFSRLCSKRYVQALLEYGESEVFLGGVWFAAGFKQEPVPIEKKDSGHTTYTFRKKLTMFINAITSFSNLPLVYIFAFGTFLSLFSFLYVLKIFIDKLFFGIDVTGWASIMASIWLVGGIIIFSLGVIGMYISKIFIETKKRPNVIVRKVYYYPDGTKN